MFEKIITDIPGCFEIVPWKIEDARGYFVKTYLRSLYLSLDLETEWREEYFSVSKRGVLRGLHFQLPPHDHAKLVYCPAGEVLDVVLDLRIGSPMYGRHLLLSLTAKKANMVYIPSGCAHGFYTVSESATMMYKVETEYEPSSDAGLLWNSAGIPWPDNNPLLSLRDTQFIPVSRFHSPFFYKSDMVST